MPVQKNRGLLRQREALIGLVRKALASSCNRTESHARFAEFTRWAMACGAVRTVSDRP